MVNVEVSGFWEHSEVPTIARFRIIEDQQDDWKGCRMRVSLSYKGGIWGGLWCSDWVDAGIVSDNVE